MPLSSKPKVVLNYHRNGKDFVRIIAKRRSHENQALHWSGPCRRSAVRRRAHNRQRWRRVKSENAREFVDRHAWRGVRVRKVSVVRETCPAERECRIGEAIHRGCEYGALSAFCGRGTARRVSG